MVWLQFNKIFKLKLNASSDDLEREKTSQKYFAYFPGLHLGRI